MSLLADLAGFSLIAFAIVLLVGQVIAREVGGYFGNRAAEKESKNEGVGVIVGGILGLLAFVLGLTLSTATTRLAERRLGGLEEANAIGTAWLQAKALGDPRAQAIAALLEDYIVARMDYIDAPHGSEEIDTANATTSALQTQIWGHLTALVEARPDPTTASLMNAINHTFDMTTAQRFAVGQSLPERMIWLLLSFTIVGMFALGFQLGLIRKPNRPLALLLSALWTAVVVLTLDMGSARLGNYRTDLRPYEWTIQSFTAIPIPAL